MDDDYDGDWGSDVTGDPQLDVFGYQTPKDRRNLTGFTAHPPNQDWLEKDRADRAARAAKREADAQAQRAAKREAERQAKRNESSGERQSTKSVDVGADENRRDGADAAQAQRDAILKRSLTELQPGQHGAYFERREVRCWYAPWKKRYRWQQVGAWVHTTPPTSGVEVVSVGSVDELDGKVRTIGTVSENGTVVY